MSAGLPYAASGRAASIERRRALSAGKAALPAPRERMRDGERSAGLPAPTMAVAATAVTAPAPTPSAPVIAVAACEGGSCREQARARRAARSQRGRDTTAPAPPTRPLRAGRLEYAPKVVAAQTEGGQRVTGLRIGRAAQVTGNEPGATLPVSGTPYIGSDGGFVTRSGGPKVGAARTPGGVAVTGTLVRSTVAVTGDEAGASVRITGEADQRIEDDLTARREQSFSTAAQFQRQSQPHGASVFGSNLGRSARNLGSRTRMPGQAIESTQRGLAITGSAVGRSVRVTGDEPGACHGVTGDQYLTPARQQSECGGSGGGTAAAELIEQARRDPVTGAKVRIGRTWSSQRISGTDLEHDPRVTGQEPGSCAILTGSPYHGPATLQGWCEPAQAAAAAQRLQPQSAPIAVTGDLPLHAGQVTGTARGALRAITGTPYYRQGPAPAPAALPVAAIDQRFSIRSPQRSAQLQRDARSSEAADGASRITGAFALGAGKITGNQEFLFHPRTPASGASEDRPAHARLTGEGRSGGREITGYSWREHAAVTGTEGEFGAQRNPSLRAGQPQAFAGAARFKEESRHGETRQIVTGMVGGSSKSAAKVTLSGGALG